MLISPKPCVLRRAVQCQTLTNAWSAASPWNFLSGTNCTMSLFITSPNLFLRGLSSASSTSYTQRGEGSEVIHHGSSSTQDIKTLHPKTFTMSLHVSPTQSTQSTHNYQPTHSLSAPPTPISPTITCQPHPAPPTSISPTTTC